MTAEVDFENDKAVPGQVIDVVGVLFQSRVEGRGNVAVDKDNGGPTAGGLIAGGFGKEGVDAEAVGVVASQVGSVVGVGGDWLKLPEPALVRAGLEVGDGKFLEREGGGCGGEGLA